MRQGRIQGVPPKEGDLRLERRGRVSKSGNSLVIRIPQEIVKSMKLKRGLPIIIYPSDKDRLVVEVESQL